MNNVKREEISKFYKNSLEKGDFNQEFFQELKGISTEMELKKFFEEKVIPIANKMGYDFSVEDFFTYEKEMMRKLSEQDLENISGGVNLGDWALKGTASLMALCTFIGSATNSVSALNLKEVANSSKVLEQVLKNNDQEISVEQDSENSQSQEGLQKVQDAASVDVPRIVNTSKLTLAQKLYVLKALNLQDAFVLLQSGVIPNLRFLGNISSISLDKLGRRIYPEDKGDAFTSLLCMLYPSNAGELNVNGGGSRLDFSKYNGISPELMAKFCVFLNDCRNNMNTIETEIDTAISCNNLMKLGRGNKQYFLDNAGTKLLERYGLIEEKPGDYLPEGKTEDNKKLKLYISFMKILKDAVKLEKDANLQYPEYLTEHILMSYMIKTLNNESDVQRFYNEVVKQISAHNPVSQSDQSDETEFSAEIERLDRLNDVISRAEFQNLSPYKEETKENGETYRIVEQADGKVKIEVKDPFADCADIAVRHIVNLLAYSNEENWNLLSPNDDEYADVNEKLKKVVDAIKNRGEVELYDLKTRLQMFFLYQRGFLEGKDSAEDKNYRSEKGADDTSSLARTLWEYVICNMDKEESTNGCYKITYNKGNFELSPGYINMLKLMWNIAKALDLGKEIVDGKTKLNLAKEKIDGLDEGTEYSEEKFEEVLKATFGMFHLGGDLTITFEQNEEKFKLKKAGTEFVGKVSVNINEQLKFDISQDLGHSAIKCMPVRFNFEEFKNFVNSNNKNIDNYYQGDEYTRLLLRSFIDDSKILEVNGFLGCFSKKGGIGRGDSFKQTELYKKYLALSVWNKLGADVENLRRISDCCTVDVMDNAGEIEVNKGKQKKKLSDVLYESYLKPNEDRINFSDFSGNIMYVINHYQPSAGEKIFLDSNRESELSQLSCIKDGETARVMINKDEGLDEVQIPSIVYDENGNQLKVTSIARGLENNLKTIKFVGDFDELNILPSAFCSCKSLENIEILGNVKKFNIKAQGVQECFSLKQFKLTQNVEDLVIGRESFAECEKLETIEMPENVDNITIDCNAFYGDEKLKILKMPKNVKWALKINNSAFNESKIETIEMPESLCNLDIEEESFSYLDELKNVILPKSVIWISFWEPRNSSKIKCTFIAQERLREEIPQWLIDSGKVQFYNESILKKDGTENELSDQ